MSKIKSAYQQGKVSIIIPMYNRASLLPETLDSILAQTYINWECILVDDGSTDDTLVVAKKYVQKDSRIKMYTRPSNIPKGANGCRNFGFSLSDGEFIQWFDSDDIMHKDLLNTGVSLLNSDIDLIVTRSKIFKENILESNDDEMNNNTIKKDSIHRILTGEDMFLTSQVILKKDFLLSCNQLFDDQLQRNQETEFFIRLLLHDVRIKKNYLPLVFIRGHINSISGKFSNASETQKLQLNYPAYYKIYFNCKKFHVLNSALVEMFHDFFYRCLRKKAVSKMPYCNLYFSGIKHKWFPSRFLATRIFLNRLIFNV